MGESGGDGREKRDEISLLIEEVIQLSVKGSMVVPSVKPSLICTIWTEKFYNIESFKAQIMSIWKTKKKFEIQMVGQNLYLIFFGLEEDLELIMEGRPWLFRKSLILFDRLNQSVERSQIRLHSSSFWVKIGPCLPEFDKKDLLHAIGVTFGGIIVANGRFPLSMKNYQCFALVVGKWGMAFQIVVSGTLQKKKKIKEDPPYALALKADSNAIGKESIKFNDLSKKNRVQCSYIGSSEMEVMNGIIQGGLQLREDEEETFKKTSWRRDASNQSRVQRKDECSTRKRKANEEEVEISGIGKIVEDRIIRLKKDGRKICREMLTEVMINEMDQSDI
ncbi:hypothetical protein Golax_022641, partial [Gossypium laxum]|nr:hypothetical protein [Gossypium laxum]